MSLQIISAEQRLAEKRGHKIVVCGASGVGKTTLARTLEPHSTLFMDLEAGDAAIEGYEIDVIRPKTWADCRDFACYLGGQTLLWRRISHIVKRIMIMCVNILVIQNKQSVNTKLCLLILLRLQGDLCFQWCTQQPESRSDRTGKLDTRAAYGLHGREMMGWLTQLQHIRSKNVVFVGILDEVTDDYGRKQYALQIEGSKTGRELPGIVDEVITMAVMAGDNGPYRAFICGALNEWGYPAKDRSGRLDTLEEPHLGKLLNKMSVGAPQAERPLDFVDPNTQHSREGELANA